MAKKRSLPLIESLHVRNYRALQDVKLDLAPLTVLLGPNGSGKSTIFDVFAFLAECFTVGLRKACDNRGRFKELRSRGQTGPIVIEVGYREPGFNKITYHLEIDEIKSVPVVKSEWLRWTRGKGGQPFKFLNFEMGEGKVVTGERPENEEDRIEERLDGPSSLAVSTLGQFAINPRIVSLRQFIVGWGFYFLNPNEARNYQESGPQEKLSSTGSNLVNVIQYLAESNPKLLIKIFDIISERVPCLRGFDLEVMPDNRALLSFKDATFKDSVSMMRASDGTLKMLQYLTVFHDPSPDRLIGIEEPENFLHPMLIAHMVEECRTVAGMAQVLVTTHSPFFLDGLRPEEVWVLHRNEEGYTEAQRVSDMPEVLAMVGAGASLGHLWMENYISGANPFDVVTKNRLAKLQGKISKGDQDAKKR